MKRRGFLLGMAGILAGAAAPAIVRADSLMRIVPRELLVVQPGPIDDDWLPRNPGDVVIVREYRDPHFGAMMAVDVRLTHEEFGQRFGAKALERLRASSRPGSAYWTPDLGVDVMVAESPTGFVQGSKGPDGHP